MKNVWLNHRIKSVMLAAFGLLTPMLSMAQESKVPVPWENIVSADDTFVFWVLASFALLLLVLIWTVAGVTKGLLSDSGIWKERWNAGAKAVAVIIGSGMLLSNSDAWAQDSAAAAEPMFQMSDGLFWIMVTVDVFLAMVLFAMLYNLSGLIRMLRTKEEEVSEKSVLENFWEGSLSEAVPVEQEGDVMLDHEYDGIRELDNKLPPWWLYMFYFTMVFGVFYIGYYHFSSGPSQQEEYEAEMALAAEQKAAFLAQSANNVDENSVVLLTDASAIEKGKATYTSLCIACHGPSGGSMPGGVGPNLTDEYWINGGGIKNVFKTIKYGVPAKGMIAWESQLTPVQMQEVASYILSLQGSNPENAKEPQGDKWIEEGAAEPAPVGADSTATEADVASVTE